jgi:hypothetical protein
MWPIVKLHFVFGARGRHLVLILHPARWVTLRRWLFSVCRMYEYVRGGFVEKELPAGAGGENSQLYEAFDSALRASSYNMWVHKSLSFLTIIGLFL